MSETLESKTPEPKGRFAFCPECKNIPQVTHSFSNSELSIQINCKCSETHKSLSFQDYLDQATGKDPSKIIINDDVCSKHRGRPPVGACSKCLLLFCKDCLKEHENKEHFIKLISFDNKIDVSEIRSKLMKTSNYYKRLNKEVLEKIKTEINTKFEELGNMIIQINETYEKNTSINENLKTLIETLINNYEQFSNYKNYNLINNISLNTQFNNRTFDWETEKKKPINEIVSDGLDYFSKNYIVTNPVSIKKQSSLQEHIGYIYSLCKIDDDNFASGSSDGTIKIWNKNKSTSLSTIKSEDGGWIYSLCKVNDKLLAASSSDGTIKVWDISSFDSPFLKATLKGHTNSVVKIILLKEKNVLVSCSYDKTIKFWDMDLMQDLEISITQEDPVTSIIELQDGRVCSGGENSIHFYTDISSKEIKVDHTIEGTKCSYTNSMIQLESGALIVADETNIKVYDVNTYELTYEVQGENQWICCLCQVGEDCLLSGGEGNSIVQWDLATRQIIQSIHGHDDCIRDILFLKDVFVSCSDDTTIHIWNFQEN